MKNEKAYGMMVGKTVERIIDGGQDCQIFVFTDGTRININNDWFNDKGITYQLLDENFRHVE